MQCILFYYASSFALKLLRTSYVIYVPSFCKIFHNSFKTTKNSFINKKNRNIISYNFKKFPFIHAQYKDVKKVVHLWKMAQMALKNHKNIKNNMLNCSLCSNMQVVVKKHIGLEFEPKQNRINHFKLKEQK